MVARRFARTAPLRRRRRRRQDAEDCARRSDGFAGATRVQSLAVRRLAVEALGHAGKTKKGVSIFEVFGMFCDTLRVTFLFFYSRLYSAFKSVMLLVLS